MALLCSKKEKKLDQQESGSQKDGLTEGNACGHCGEALAKRTGQIAGLDKLLDLVVSIVQQGSHTMTQDKISLRALGGSSERLEQRALQRY